MRFERLQDQVHSDDFVWFTSENDFCLCKGVYIHNNSVTWFDPYALYWLIKYKRWFKKNIVVSDLPKWEYR